jgi:GNAT superfamily N-acetyltransferase
VNAARPATADDLADLAALAAVAVDELRPERGGELWARTIGRRAPYEPALAAAMVDPTRLLLCGTLGGSTVGYASARLDELADGGRLAVIEDLYTLPDAREVGVGEALMDAVLVWARAEGAVGVDAVALPGMRHTKNFFETFGLTARAIVVHRDLR